MRRGRRAVHPVRYFLKEVDLGLPSDVWAVHDRLQPTMFRGAPLLDDDGQPFYARVAFSYEKANAEAIECVA